ncbi:hypothetical protein QBC45DRAFT_323173 [Copromyces sp. CBS 386.78]|nr:hypothetical protein QBC45DRAFT_323173 [Copromyces sp. CBS 386.78]
MDNKPEYTQTENVVEKPRKRGCAGHCLKFWWAYLIALIVIVVIVVPVILLVAVPKIAQDKLDHAELTLDSIKMTNSRAHNFTMSINTEIQSDGKVKARIEPFEGVMYLEDLPEHRPFAKVHFPETNSEKSQIVNVTQFTMIDDMEAFTTFNTWLLHNETFRVTVEGPTKVHVKGIAKAYGVTFKKTIEMPGLRMLDGTIVSNTTVNSFAKKGVNNFFGTVQIPNYSKVAFELGNATFHNYLLDKEIGTVYLDNLSLKPGNDNVYPMRATIDDLGYVTGLAVQKPYCDKLKGVLPFKLRGKSVVNNGESLSYIADALATGNQTVQIDIRGTVERSMGITLGCTDDE